MSQSRTTPRNASVAPLYAAQPQRTPARHRAGALLMGTALSAVIGLGYGRGAYAQDQGTLSGPNNQTVIRTGPGTFETSDGFSVTTTSGRGVFIDNGTYDPVSFIDANGSSITSDDRGVYVKGDGDVIISITGDVSTTNGLGVYGKSGYSGNVSISASGTVNAGAQTGIYAYNWEDGAGAGLSITANNVYAPFNGVAAYGYGDISVTTNEGGTVRGGVAGIEVTNAGNQYGTGQSINITTNGSVIGDAGNGIEAYNDADGELRIEANGSVTGGTTGIYADNDGGGALSITTTGTVAGAVGNGIYASNSANGGNLSIDTAAVTGEAFGIYANNLGNGSLSITATGDVVGRGNGDRVAYGTRQAGIKAVNGEWNGTEYSSGPASLTVYVENVTGQLDANTASDGINAANYGAGGLNIQASGKVVGGISGVRAWNSEVSENLSVDVHDVYGIGLGIDARQHGSAALTVTASGLIEAANYSAIYARNYNGTALDIDANDVTGGFAGIAAYSDSGVLSITTTGAVTGTARYGILAKAYGVGAANVTDLDGNSLQGVSLAITANNATGGTTGIYADNDGSGALSITTTGTVTGTAEDGIYAANGTWDAPAGTTMMINTADVIGGSNGIRALQYGTGAVNITTGNVEGNGDAIFARNGGTDAMSITVAGDITSRSNDGIRARNARNTAGSFEGAGTDGSFEGAGTDLMVTVLGNINAADDGVDTETTIPDVNHQISVTGDIDVGDNGIEMGAFAARTAHIDVTGSIYAGDKGVYAGTGVDDLRVSITGNITSGDDGIYAWNFPGEIDQGTTEVRVTGNVRAGDRGIYAATTVGANTVRSDGDIVASDEGIYAVKWSDTFEGDLTITANNVTGGTKGIYAFSAGNGALAITANGAVTGSTDDGIYAKNASTEDLTITINEGGSVSTSGTDTANDFAIEAVANNGAVIVNNFGTVTGRVNLTNSNTFTNAGTWDLAGTTSNFNATGNSLVVNEGLIIAASDGAAAETSVIDNLDTFRSNAGGTIRLTDGSAGDVFEIATSTSGLGNFEANGGTVTLDVVLGGDGSAADRLDISGDVILDGAPTALAFNSVGGGTGGETTTGIEVVSVGDSSDAGAFVLAGPVEVGALSYDLSRGQCDDTANENWYLCNNGTIGTTGAVFEAMPGIVLNSFARIETLQQRLGARVQGGTGPTLSTQGDADLPVAQSVGPWMRTWGDFADITPDNSTAGSSWEANSLGLEAGIGTLLGSYAGGELVGGVNLRYGATYADLSNPVGTASLNAKGIGAAASLTWFGDDGLYVDANGAMDFVSVDATSQGGGELLNDYDDVVHSANLEVGNRIELEGGTSVVPQAQLTWGTMRDGSFTDNLGNVVSFADRETLTSRVGLTVEQDVTDPAWGSGKVYGFGNVLHDLAGSRTATVAGTDVMQSGSGDWVELGGGFSLQPTENSNVFGQVSYREAFNGVDGDAIAVSAGWRMQW